MNYNKLLVTGPSKTVNFLTPEVINLKRDQGYKILSYGDSIKRFLDIGIYPDYWTFVDPNTVLHFQNEIKSGKFHSVNLIVPDLFSEECKKFYLLKWTSNALERNKDLFFEMERNFDKSFAQYYKFDFQTILGIGDKVNYKEKLYIHLRKNLRDFINPCKFSYNLLPLIFFVFKEYKKFEFLGFGNYNYGRYFNNGFGGYTCYKKCYDLIKPNFIKYIKNNHLEIKFLDNESYFKDLQI